MLYSLPMVAGGRITGIQRIFPLFSDPVPYIPVQTSLRDYIHPASSQIFEILYQSHLVKETPPVLKVDEKIHITPFRNIHRVAPIRTRGHLLHRIVTQCERISSCSSLSRCREIWHLISPSHQTLCKNPYNDSGGQSGSRIGILLRSRAIWNRGVRCRIFPLLLAGGWRGPDGGWERVKFPLQDVHPL